MKSNQKLKIVWEAERKEFVATSIYTNVKGYGRTIGDAITNFQFWWNIPY